MNDEGGIKRETLQSIIGGFASIMVLIISAAISVVWNDVQTVKTNQEIHNSASDERAKNLNETIVDMKANNLKQWDVIDARTEKETAQEVKIAVNENNIKHLQDD